MKNKIAKALTEIIGAESVKQLETVLDEVEASIEENNKAVLSDAKVELENKVNKKLVEHQEKKEKEIASLKETHEAELEALHQALEQKAYEGYQQAANIIEGLTAKVESLQFQLNESESIAYRGYEQAAKSIEDLKTENENLHIEASQHMQREFAVAKLRIEEARAEADKSEGMLYEAYERRLADAKSTMVDLIDSFLKERVSEFDKAVQEARVEEAPESLADRIAELAVEHGAVIDGKVDAASTRRLQNQISELQAECRQLRQQHIKLESEKEKALTEATQVRKIMTEQALADERAKERKEIISRQQRAESIQGHGKVVLEGACEDGEDTKDTDIETEKEKSEGGSASKISEEIVSEPGARKRLVAENRNPAAQWNAIAFQGTKKKH